MEEIDQSTPISAEPAQAAAWEAVRLLRASRAGSLATSEAGQPFASLVTPGADSDRSLLMLLSGLSPHTRHLRDDARCAIMLCGAPTGPNPQTAPRLSLVGRAAPEPDPAAKARWLAQHPYAAFYAELGDFQLWRFRPERGQFVGGFARAHRLAAGQLAADPAAIDALRAAEARILEHCNDDHADAMDAIARAQGGQGAGWRMVTCDVDGCDLAQGETVRRVDWAAPVASAGAVRAELVRLTAAARNRVLDAGP